MGRLTHRTLGRARARSAACVVAVRNFTAAQSRREAVWAVKGELGSSTGECPVPAWTANAAAPTPDGPEEGYSFPLSFMR